MQLLFLQHVPFEGPANIGQWARCRSHDMQVCHLYQGQPLPDMSGIDWLVIMGGPMNIYEHDSHPWLVHEKQCIRQAIDAGKTVLGVCLGAQLIADVLGGRVTAGAGPEIGWYDVTLDGASTMSASFRQLPTLFEAFHWHGDTFSIPPGATPMARNEFCPNQAFQYNHNVIGLQFHLDYDAHAIRAMLAECGEELIDSPQVMSEQRILQRLDQRTERTRELLFAFLDGLAAVE